jgi:UDP-N-acetylmuramoylalanine--D-glutamate ligase
MSLPNITSIAGKRVAVVGLGASGVAAARLLLRRGARIIGFDQKPLAQLGSPGRSLEALGVPLITGGDAFEEVKNVDLVLVSPGVPSFSALARVAAQGVPIWGEVELATRFIPKDVPVIAVGGTNGKSTTTTLIGELLATTGKRVFIGGNLGTPLADHVDDPLDFVVLEVSSFQMDRVDQFHPTSALLLNVTPDHLDRYPSLQAYADAKGNAFLRQDAGDDAIVPAQDPICSAQAARGGGRRVTFGQGGDVDVTDAAVIDRRTGDSYERHGWLLPGTHNAINVAASIACVTRFGVTPAAIRATLATFRGLPHRTTFVRELEGVRYYDDSKGTNVGAAVTAVRGMREERVVLIAGGREKGGSYTLLVDALASRGRGAVLVGEAAAAIERAIDGAVPTARATSMREAVLAARSLALAGDAVLLSPACSSFDMFRDYKERGDAFVEAVLSLEEP